MDLFPGALFVIAMFAIPIGLLAYRYMQHEKIKDELYKLVKQSGAQNISIESNWMRGSRGAYFFTLNYRDVDGSWQTRQVSRQTGDFGQAYGEFMWDQPLTNGQDAPLSSRLGSKEQIISDMEAEIKRLQKELELSRKER